MSSPETAEVPKKKSKALLLVGALGVLVMVSAAAFFIWHRSRQIAKTPAEAPKITSVLHLETFVVNLADDDQRTFLRIGIELGLAKPDKEKKEKEGGETKSDAPVRDVVLSTLMSAHATDLATAEGKQKLKEQILRSINEHQPELQAREVYFTEFLVQR